MATEMRTVERSRSGPDVPDDQSIDKTFEPVTTSTELPSLLRDLSEDELRSLEKKLVRKIDTRLLPTLIVIYIMNYLDRFVALAPD